MRRHPAGRRSVQGQARAPQAEAGHHAEVGEVLARLQGLPVGPRVALGLVGLRAFILVGAPRADPVSAEQDEPRPCGTAWSG